MARDWYLYQGGQKKGPFSWQELCRQARAGSIKSGDQIWAEGMARWARARDVTGLLPADAPAPAGQTAVQQPPLTTSPPPIPEAEPPAVPGTYADATPSQAASGTHFESSPGYAPAAASPPSQGKHGLLIAVITLLAVIILGGFMLFGGMLALFY